MSPWLGRRRVRRLGLVLGLLVWVGALLAPQAWAGALQALVTDASSASSSATPIDLGTDMAGSAVATGGSEGLGVAISPDARTAYVVNAGQTGATGQVTPLDLTTDPPTAEATINIPNDPGNFIAISPDGRLAYVTDPSNGEVFPIDLTTSPATVETGIAVGGNPEGVAFSPNGSTAYVAENANAAGTAEVIPITVATNTADPPITGVGPHPFSIAISPDGSHAYVGDAGSGSDGKVYPIGIPSGTVGAPITIGGSDVGIAITPDGSRAYVANGTSVTPITLANNTAGSPISVTGGAFAVAAAPDSKTVYVTNDSGHTVTPIAVATDTAQTAITSVGNAPREIAITPDQAPVANFTVTSEPAGSSTAFDASASTVRYGTISTYAWDFGDGQAATTSTPTTSHIYASPGSYTATVTETDSDGTSVSGEVFTGQTASSVGNASARTSRSVVVPAPGVASPAVRLSASSLDFGPVAVGNSSPPQRLTVSNTGTAALSISGSSLSGPQAGDFVLSADGCTHQRIAAGASCSVTVVLRPSAGGARTAALSFTDNASGSPQTATLNGIGTAFGAISGRVLRTDGTAVAGAQLQACPLGTRNCQTATSNSVGGYAFGGLKPGTYGLEAISTQPGLFPAAAVLTVAAGPPLNHDFTLSAPRPLPAGVVFNGAGSGVPTSFWQSPSSLTLKLTPAGSQPAGTYSATVVNFDAGANGSSLQSHTALTVVYRYDATGAPRFVATLDGDPLATAPGRPPAASSADGPLGSWSVGLASAPTTATDVRGADVTGILTPAAEPFHGGASISYSEYSFGLARAGASQPVLIRLAGITSGLAFAPLSGASAAKCPVDINASSDQGNPTAAVYVWPNGARYYPGEGVPGTTAVGPLYTGNQAPPGVAPGVVPVPPVLYGLGGNSVFPNSGGRFLSLNDQSTGTNYLFDDNTGVVYAPPGPGGMNGCGGNSMGGTFNVYTDPSGSVSTSGHVPVADATVTLQRAAHQGARLRPVANGSVVMSPGNRRNPDRTTAEGLFGWDVLSGYYRVTASHPGCAAVGRSRTARTRELRVPPAVLGLRLTLRCPHLKRSTTHVALRARRVPVAQVMLLARVRGRGRPSGVLTFSSGRRKLGVAPLSARSGSAEITVPARLIHGVVSVSYGGSGLLKAGRAQARPR
jgi:YVTN family beta-propeller protein